MRQAIKTIEIYAPNVNQGGTLNRYGYTDVSGNYVFEFPVTDQCERSAQLMGDDYVRLQFDLTAYVPMAAFSFIRYGGQTFFLMTDYCPTSNGSRRVYDGQGNASVESDSYKYDLKFYSVANMLRKPICYRHVKVAKGATQEEGYYEWDEPELTVSANLPTMYVIIVGSIGRYTERLDGSLMFKQMLDTIVSNGIAANGISPKEGVKLTQGTELSTFSFDGSNIADVCTGVANQFSDEKKETEWYIVEDENHSLTLHFCKCEDTENSIYTADDFSYKDTSTAERYRRPVISGGLLKVEYSRDISNIPQVLVPFGSDRNMTYAAVKGIDVVSQMQSTFGKRVRLEPDTEYTVRDFQDVEHTITTDNHGGLVNDKVNTGVERVEMFNDVYPQCHFVITSVEEKTVRKDGSSIPQYTCEGQVIDSQGHIIQPEGNFYPIQIEEGKTLSVRFESGFLNGREFEIENKTKKKTNSSGTPETNYTLRFTIVADGSIEDGTLIPSGNFKPTARVENVYEGDRFALFNMKMPEEYITYAQNELAQVAYEKLLEYQETVPDVKCTSNPDTFSTKEVYFGARYCINSEKLGFTLNEYNRRVPVDFISRVIAYSYKLTQVNDVQFTLSSSIVRGVLAEMANAITSVSYATEGLGQRSVNLSRRGWRDAAEVADMISSMTTEMMLVGNQKYQFAYTSDIVPTHASGAFTGLDISYGTLQHTQEPYIGYGNGGMWQIPKTTGLNTDVNDEPLDGTKPYYLFAICSDDNLESASLVLIDKEYAEENNIYRADTEQSDSDPYPAYMLLGILSSEYEETNNGTTTHERVFSRTNGFTAIEGGAITTEQIQDANRQLIIDFQSMPPRIIAKGGAEIIGNIRFLSADGTKKTIDDIIDEMEIGGENLYSGDADITRTLPSIGTLAGTIKTGVAAKLGKHYVVSVSSFTPVSRLAYAEVIVYKSQDSLHVGTINGTQLYATFCLDDIEGGSDYEDCEIRLQLHKPGLQMQTIFTLTGIMVQEGTKPTEYHPYVDYLTAAFENAARQGSTDVDGGLLMTSLLKLRNENGDVTSGMSGLCGTVANPERVLLWGGGTYAEALNASDPSNDYHKSGSTGELIQTLIRKDGTGKIGIFQIDNTKCVIDAPSIGKIILDLTTGITIQSKSGNSYIDRVLISPKSIGDFAVDTQSGVLTGHGALQNTAYASGYTDTYFATGGDPYANYRESSGNSYLVTKAENKAVVKVTVIGGSGNCYIQFNGSPLSLYGFLEIGGEQITVFQKTDFGGSEWWNSDNNIVVTRTLTNLPFGTIKPRFYISYTTGMTIQQISMRVNIDIKYDNIDKKAILGQDGMLLCWSNRSYFKVLNDSNGQKMIMNGLPTSDPHISGQLYEGESDHIIRVSDG